MSPPLVAAVVKLRVQRAVFPCPALKHPGTFFACAVTPELRVNAEFHNEALAVLRSEDYRHSKTDVLPIPVEEQEVAAILRPAMNLHHVIVILRTKEVFQILTVWIWENIPLVVDMKLLPEDSDIVAIQKEFTELYNKADAIVDDNDARMAAFAEAEALLQEHALTIPCYVTNSLQLTKIDPNSQMISRLAACDSKMKNWVTNVDGFTGEEIAASRKALLGY